MHGSPGFDFIWDHARNCGYGIRNGHWFGGNGKGLDGTGESHCGVTLGALIIVRQNPEEDRQSAGNEYWNYEGLKKRDHYLVHLSLWPVRKWLVNWAAHLR